VAPDYDCTRTCMHRYILALGAVSENGNLALDLVISRLAREMRLGGVPIFVVDCCCCSIRAGRFGLMSDLASMDWFRVLLEDWYRVLLRLWPLHGNGPADGRFGSTPP
jgi:hypothetical protein